ncbi:unnamed protein product [Didymodactylos carnosus]|uniref:Uncharacterized protein n=1 Tax=Didymodactylos carnosus TaxID=1234261 RepID=A0A815GR85_9BILA|nr:unnamed protein product [Didymodactylos carnosus]CAF1341969.1 unnamed protein product [Didymodactylos carnosus]CAF3949643.1 unnamed protein product [Didymodactylos carnosus]CAF4203936.1 unnamed protein product [Didymodactylos carnosus]
MLVLFATLLKFFGYHVIVLIVHKHLGKVIKKYWKMSNKNTNNKKKKKEYIVALLLGGCVFDESTNIKIKNRRRRQQHTKEEIRLELQWWERDFDLIKTFFEQKDIFVWRSIPTSLFCSKRETAELIQKFFQLYRNQQFNKITYLIYWCGHGDQDTGNWTFSDDGEITLRELMYWWQQSRVNNLFENEDEEWKQYNVENKDFLTIIADTCYSGCWIEELEKLNEKNLDIALQAACRSDEEAWITNDDKIPRSLLMRKLICDSNQIPKEYTWTCSRQHPLFACTYMKGHKIINTNVGERYFLVNGQFRFSTIDQHWIIKSYEEDDKTSTAQLNGITRTGNFLKDF